MAMDDQAVPAEGGQAAASQRPAISPEISGIEDRIVKRLQEMAAEAKAYRLPYEERARRCKLDRSSIHDKTFEEGRASYFLPLASTYAATWVSANVEAQLPQSQFFVCEADEEPGKAYEKKIETQMLHICDVVDFARVIRESYWNFTDYGYTAVLVQRDPEVDYPRPEVVPSEDVWIDPRPMSGTRDERIGRYLRRTTTISNLLLEQERSGGQKYDQAALDELVESIPTQKQDKPSEVELWSYWGDIYVDQGQGQPTRLLGQWSATWVESPKAKLVACNAIDTPGNVAPLHIFCYKQNAARDLYGEPILWAGVGVQGLCNSALNQGLDRMSLSLKPTPWLRKGSAIAKRGIVFGQPMVSEKMDDIGNPLGSLETGAGAESVFNLLPMMEQEYARAVGATHTHSVEEAPRTATEQAIRSAVVEVRTKHGNRLVGEALARILEQVQQLEAQRILLAALGQEQPPEDMADGEPVVRRSLDQSDGEAFSELPPEMWAFRYPIKMIGPGVLGSRAERMIGTQAFYEVLQQAVALDPTIPARFKAGDAILKRYSADSMGYDHEELLIPLDEYQRMELMIRSQVQAEMAQAVEAQAAAAGDSPAGEGESPAKQPGEEANAGQSTGSPLAAARSFGGP